MIQLITSKDYKPQQTTDEIDLIKNILEKKLDKYINKEDDAQKIELLKGIKFAKSIEENRPWCCKPI